MWKVGRMSWPAGGRSAPRAITVEAGEAAEFSTMIPHAFGAHDGPAEILCIFDHDGQRTHLRPLP